MCGICGKLSWKTPPDEDLIRRMSSKLIHRGPDASGIFLDGPIGLGHRRLSIIDTSVSGNQPLKDFGKQCVIIFNGEIYNYLELRKELIQYGFHFATDTDTEVILNSYLRWGTDCITKFNGMFAFALWDTRKKILFIGRDRLGKKPLFYMKLPDGGIIFASEIKALLEDPALSSFSINPFAVSQYLSLNYVLSSQCIVKGVEKLDAACFMTVDEKGVSKKKYWFIEDYFKEKHKYSSESEASEYLNDLLVDSVERRMISDVPLGAFLSGGIDSSCIVAAMSRIGSPDRTCTFSIGFHEKTYSELPEARQVASLLKVIHRDKIVDADMAALLPHIVYYADEPFADTSMIPMFFLSQFTRNHVTVSLSGDGSDEIFAGYETYVADKIQYYSRILPSPLVKLGGYLSNRFLPVTYDKVSADYKIRQFFKGVNLAPWQAHYSWREIFSEDEKRMIFAPSLRQATSGYEPFVEFRDYASHVEQCNYIDQAQYVDLKTWLVDDILVKVDRTTMAHSLEARAPFLDHRIVEFAASLPVDMKLKGFDKKYILKKAQSRYLPNEVLYRKKRGFNSPISHWINSTLEKYVSRYVSSSDNPLSDIIDTKILGTLVDEHRNLTRDNSLKIFSLINFGLWLDVFVNKMELPQIQNGKIL